MMPQEGKQNFLFKLGNFLLLYVQDYLFLKCIAFFCRQQLVMSSHFAYRNIDCRKKYLL